MCNQTPTRTAPHESSALSSNSPSQIEHYKVQQPINSTFKFHTQTRISALPSPAQCFSQAVRSYMPIYVSKASTQRSRHKDVSGKERRKPANLEQPHSARSFFAESGGVWWSLVEFGGLQGAHSKPSHSANCRCRMYVNATAVGLPKPSKARCFPESRSSLSSSRRRPSIRKTGSPVPWRALGSSRRGGGVGPHG